MCDSHLEKPLIYGVIQNVNAPNYSQKASFHWQSPCQSEKRLYSLTSLTYISNINQNQTRVKMCLLMRYDSRPSLKYFILLCELGGRVSCLSPAGSSSERQELAWVCKE